MRSIRRGVCVALLVTSFSATPIVAAEPDATLLERVAAGDAVLDFRYRFERVRDDAPATSTKDADASTLRTVVGYRSATWKGLHLRVDAENVSVIGEDLYDNAGAGASGNGVVDRPVVADPAGTALLRANVGWQGPAFAVQVGRDEITLGDQRFVGNVGWRQHHQSFDAITIRSTALRRIRLFYGYLDAVHRINRATDEPPVTWATSRSISAEPAASPCTATCSTTTRRRAGASRLHLRRGVGRQSDLAGGKLGYELELANRATRATTPGGSTPATASPSSATPPNASASRGATRSSTAAPRKGSSTRRWRRCTSSTAGPTSSSSPRPGGSPTSRSAQAGSSPASAGSSVITSSIPPPVT